MDNPGNPVSTKNKNFNAMTTVISIELSFEVAVNTVSENVSLTLKNWCMSLFDLGWKT